MKELFLDANAHIPVNSAALKTFIKFNSSRAGHGHALSPSAIGREAASALECARAKFASLIGASSANQIVFTSGCTQACEWGVDILRSLPSQNEDEVWMSKIEHPAVSMAAEKYFNKINYLNILYTRTGIVDFDYNNECVDTKVFSTLEKPDYNKIIEKTINCKNKKLICVHMQNEIGCVEMFLHDAPYKYILSDMSQSLGKVSWGTRPFDITLFNVDIATFGAHKFGGWGQVGMLYLKDSNMWREFGSGSRYALDIPGTPNVAGIVASVDGLEHTMATFFDREKKMIEFRDIIEPALEEMGFNIVGKNIPAFIPNMNYDLNRCPNTTFCRTPKSGDAIRILSELGYRGVYCGLGSACGSLYTNGSPLMTSLGLPSDGMDYLRISQWGDYGVKEANLFIDTLKKII